MSSLKLTEDKRKFTRQPTSLSCQIDAQFSAVQSTVDISRGGSRIYSDERLPVGSTLQLKFFVPGNDSLNCEVKVAWLRETTTDSPAKYEVGLQFLEISEASLNTLLNLPDSTSFTHQGSHFHSVSIREVVQQALLTGYLTIEAEERLRELLRTKYDSEDLCAFFTLQKATSEGFVSQESRLKQYPE